MFPTSLPIRNSVPTAKPMEDWKTLSLPMPNSSVTHTLFYKVSSALEVDVFNLPLSSSPESQQQKLCEIFAVFGRVESVTLLQNSQSATVKFESTKGIQRASEGRRKHARDLPLAVAGTFGIEHFIEKYNEVHPPIETLERTSSEFIRAFEEKEQKDRTKRVVRMTEAEQQELLRKFDEKVKKMQSTDFYAFQQKDRPNLVTELLANDGPAPRHLKKKPKVKGTEKGKKN
jgi:hypothetical protein